MFLGSSATFCPKIFRDDRAGAFSSLVSGFSGGARALSAVVTSDLAPSTGFDVATDLVSLAFGSIATFTSAAGAASASAFLTAIGCVGAVEPLEGGDPGPATTPLE